MEIFSSKEDYQGVSYLCLVFFCRQFDEFFDLHQFHQTFGAKIKWIDSCYAKGAIQLHPWFCTFSCVFSLKLHSNITAVKQHKHNDVCPQNQRKPAQEQLLINCWLNWPLLSFSPTFYEQFLRQFPCANFLVPKN